MGNSADWRTEEDFNANSPVDRLDIPPLRAEESLKVGMLVFARDSQAADRTIKCEIFGGVDRRPEHKGGCQALRSLMIVGATLFQ